MRLLYVMVVGTLCLSTLSQRSGYAQAPDTVADIARRIVELGDVTSDVPDNQSVLIRELDKLDKEIADLQSEIDAPSWAEDMPKIENLQTDIASAAAAFASLDCTTQLPEFRNLLRVYSDYVSFLSSFINEFDKDISIAPLERPILYFPNVDSNTLCSDTKLHFSDAKNGEERIDVFSTILTEMKERIDRSKQYDSDGAKLLELLKQRRDIIRLKLNSTVAQDRISNNLPMIMGIIGLFSISTILVIRAFSENIQTEWVASGQVIQFVTVMILLSAIMALGLSGILKEETLGTLLGGVAGYVLAQGVGRAAARDVARSVGLSRSAAARRAAPPAPPVVPPVAPAAAQPPT